jgi:hypothetical protein
MPVASGVAALIEATGARSKTDNTFYEEAEDQIVVEVALGYMLAASQRSLPCG